ncbi:hypothetical protein SAMN05421781_0510 [Marinococcus luteus]|uniref:Uncharacterized protein n=1 Tax=Marinococcus luteus TaxID=1122204 RepID=A0A1H2QZC3_9BACI|nr:hypothetical protein [Marinococcus luteus]SDW11984.1 hypothetical protein SAMN05421781_0510 [Marinococcus luteus]
MSEAEQQDKYIRELVDELGKDAHSVHDALGGSTSASPRFDDKYAVAASFLSIANNTYLELLKFYELNREDLLRQSTEELLEEFREFKHAAKRTIMEHSDLYQNKLDEKHRKIHERVNNQ